MKLEFLNPVCLPEQCSSVSRHYKKNAGALTDADFKIHFCVYNLKTRNFVLKGFNQ